MKEPLHAIISIQALECNENHQFRADFLYSVYEQWRYARRVENAAMYWRDRQGTQNLVMLDENDFKALLEAANRAELDTVKPKGVGS